MERKAQVRRAGVSVPLFSLTSTRSWGIGEIPDIVPFAQWLEAAGLTALQILPITEVPAGETSPYSPLSAMAIDPQFIALADVEDFAAAGGEAALGAALRADLDTARQARAIDYRTLRRVKGVALRRSFDHFHSTEWAGGSGRSKALAAFVEEQAWWLDDYVLFRALHDRHGGAHWTSWPEPIRGREPGAMAAARQALASEIRYFEYLQWLAAGQWAAARAAASGLAIYGDLPFMVGGHSADVWARQEEFRLDVSLGVPPDAFSKDGQDWGLPIYRWDVVEAGGFAWLRQRARRNAELYDGYRVDHLVGFYRTYYRTSGGNGHEGTFTPDTEDEQTALGERVLDVFREPGAHIIAEDLGLVPAFVRASLARLGVAGFKVLRWEREWDTPGQPFIDPVRYPAVSVATSGTHDTEPLAIWWRNAPEDERAAVEAIPMLRQVLDRGLTRVRPGSDPGQTPVKDLTIEVRDALLEVLFAAGSELLLLPVQDLFGWADRINVPGTMGGANWTWRLPWRVDQMDAEPVAIAQAGRLRAWSGQHGR
ncbi:MAG: 4-alpha-glucanotransferase [Acidimicrobiia bacterium]|nr:4-alpha-glucanotransferase [Acidimicrobiia bacterium]